MFNIAQIAKLSQNREVYLTVLKDFVAHTNGSVKVDPIREIIAELDPSYRYPSAESNTEIAGPPEKEIAPEPAVSPSKAAELTTTEKASEKPKRRGMKIAGFALLGTGIAAAAAGGALQGLAAAAQKDAQSADTLDTFNESQSRMSSMQIGAVAGFATGGTLILSGAILVLISNKGGESVGVSLAPMPGGFTITGRF